MVMNDYDDYVDDDDDVMLNHLLGTIDEGHD